VRKTLLSLLAAAFVLAIGGFVLAQVPKETGRIGPQNKIQPSCRQLVPAGKRTVVGNHPGGGALTRNGRFYWTLSAGRGRNDIRIVRSGTGKRCRRAKKPRRPRAHATGTQALSAAGAPLPRPGAPHQALRAQAQASDRQGGTDDPHARPERRHGDGARWAHRLRLGHA